MGTHLQPEGVRPGERPQAQLRIYLLGRFEVVREDAPIPPHAWRRRRPADLLKLVALAPGRDLPREEAIAALWPDKDPASGANNLHRALYDLRQILGGRWVDVDRGRIHMRPDVWLDVDAFERAAAEGGRPALTRAVALYRGDLSPEDREAAWLRPRRASLRARFAEAALPLARETAAEGDAHLSVPILRRLLEIDPASEEAHRLLMRLLAESGRRAEALRQYDACERAMRAGGLGPSDDARALRAAIQRGDVGPAQAPVLDGARRASRRLLGTPEPPPVRGRGPILLLVEALLERGHGALVLLGERGVGKTRLAVEGARLAQARGAAVLCGLGGTAPGVPYALFQDALRAAARANPSAPDPFSGLPLAGGVAGEPVRRAVFEGVEHALRAFADGRPLYLLLDEIHLADESSLNLLHFLAREARGLRLVAVATCDESAVRGGTAIQMALAHLDCGRLARGVRVPRLDLAGTREQVRDLLEGTPDEAVLARIYRMTDGSPRLVEEVVRSLRESPTGALPADPLAAVRERVARLGEKAGTLLAAASVAGVRFDLDLATRAAGLGPDEAGPAIEACLAAGILDGDGALHQFHGGFARDAVYDGLAPAWRAWLHSAVADELEARATFQEPASETIARHRLRAGQEDRALRHLVAAGHRAAASAGLREALAFYEEALALASRPGAAGGPARFEILEATGRVQLGLGELTGSARAFFEAARLLDPSGYRPEPVLRARSHRLAALSLAAGGRIEEARAEIEEGLAHAADAGGEGTAPLLHLRAQLFWHDGRNAEALAAAEGCVAAADRAMDADLVSRGRDMAALARAAAGEPPAPEPVAGGVPQETEPEHPVDVHLLLWERDLLGDGDACALVARLAGIHSERARMRDARGALAVGRTGEGIAALAAGRIDAAEVALRSALHGHRAAGSALGEALVLERLAALLTAAGRIDEALALLDEGIVVAERASLRRHALVRLHVTEARNRLAAGADRSAEDAIREASETAARHGDCLVCDAAFRPESIRVLVARGRVEDASREAAAFEDVARRSGGAALQALALGARARVLAAEGRAGEALAALETARAALEAGGHLHEASRLARLAVRIDPDGASPGGRALSSLVRVEADA